LKYLPRIVAIIAFLAAAASTWALDPLPTPKPVEPRNKKDATKFGDAREIKGDGYFLYSTKEGIAISPIQAVSPQVIPGTGPNPTFIDISDDGRWIVFSLNDDAFLIRPDGSGKTRLPITARAGNKDNRGAAVGFYHHGPLGDEVVYIADDRTLECLAVDLSADVPKPGKTRKIVDFSKVEANKLAWISGAEQRMTVARNHVFICKAGWAGAAQETMITIPDGGKGTATSEKDEFVRMKAPKWECGPAMSHNGEIVAQNPGDGDPERIPVKIGHKGPVVYPFMECDQPGLDTTRGLYHDKALAICWVPESVRNVDGDWHHWFFSNDPGYLIGTSQGRRNLNGKVEEFKGIGIYVLHWPTGVYYRVSDDKTRAHYMACHFFRPETKSEIRLPAGLGKAVARLPATTAKGEPATQQQAPRQKVVLEVTAVELSAVPAKGDVGVYKHISRFIRYDVQRVVSGSYAGKSIVIGHWSVRDEKFTDAAQYKDGERFVITCQPMGSEDETTLSQRIDDITDIDLPRYWALSVEARK
jgi:hypothetical protein